jgi:hypothetical protein
MAFEYDDNLPAVRENMKKARNEYREYSYAMVPQRK